MKVETKKSKAKLVAVRLPQDMHDLAVNRSQAEDITFSQLVRRAVRKEIGLKIK